MNEPRWGAESQEVLLPKASRNPRRSNGRLVGHGAWQGALNQARRFALIFNKHVIQVVKYLMPQITSLTK